MLRALVATAVLLLAGCAGPPQPAAEPLAVEPQWVMTATRVEPKGHPMNWEGQLAAHPCALDGSGECRGAVIAGSGLAAGITWEEPTLEFPDPDALFWRVDLEVSWSSDNPFVQDVEFEISTLPNCESCAERVVETFTGPSPVVLEKYNVFLEDGEIGLRLKIRPPPNAAMETAWGAAAVSFNVEGVVAGFHAVAEPVESTGNSA